MHLRWVIQYGRVRLQKPLLPIGRRFTPVRPPNEPNERGSRLAAPPGSRPPKCQPIEIAKLIYSRASLRAPPFVQQACGLCCCIGHKLQLQFLQFWVMHTALLSRALPVLTWPRFKLDEREDCLLSVSVVQLATHPLRAPSAQGSPAQRTQLLRVRSGTYVFSLLGLRSSCQTLGPWTSRPRTSNVKST